MSETFRPIPRRILAMFLTDHESIKIFEDLQKNAGQTLPAELLEIQFAAGSADAKAEQALGALDRIAHALEMLALAPHPAQSQPDLLLPSDVLSVPDADLQPPSVASEQRPYGGMYLNAVQAVAVAAAGTAYELAAGCSAGLAHLVTFGGAHYLQVDRGGVFWIEWSLSVAAGAGDDIEAGIMVDGAAQTPGRADGNMGAAGSRHELSGQAFIKLSPLQQVSLFVINQTAAVNIDVYHMSCTISLIDRRIVT
ncbi:MAG: hypothetical protein WC736_15650 [Gallionella sp.]|jgi:hypothetical protein